MEKIDRWIELAHRSTMSADRAERLLGAIKKGNDGEGMKVVREESRVLLRRAFLLWLRTWLRV